jgi:hypothetical protein
MSSLYDYYFLSYDENKISIKSETGNSTFWCIVTNFRRFFEIIKKTVENFLNSTSVKVSNHLIYFIIIIIW